MSGRDKVALRTPDGRDLSSFPTVTVPAHAQLYRGHRATRGAWYFSAGTAGRFDLDAPRGTCYLATDPETAVREVVGAVLHSLGGVDAEFAAQRAISRLHLPAARNVANLCDKRAADFGVTREIHTLTPYDTTRAWARALDTITDGVQYESRFTTAPPANALALFDTAGPKKWRDDTTPLPFTVAARDAGITILRPPHRVTIIEPPT